MRKIIILICLLLFGTFGLKYALAQNNSQNSTDNQLVPNVLQFKAIPGDKHTTLSWSNSKSSDFSGVIIQRSTDNYVTAYDSGQNIYKGTGSSYVDLDLANGQTYYYTIFEYNSSGSYSSGAIAKAIPGSPSLVSPYQEASKDYIDTNQGKPLTSSKKVEKIEFTDFYYYLVIDKKPLEIGLDDLSNLRVTNDSMVLIEIPSNIFAKPLNVITASTDETSYLMKLIPDKKKYQVVIPAPSTKGNHELRFVAVFDDRSISDLKTKLVVDPRGYIYSASSNFLGLGRKQEMRIDGAKVTIYQKNNNGWKIWNAGEYFQQNPQLTNSSGEYAFYVPSGEYYLAVEKAGYKTVKSDSFKIDNLILNKNVEMQLKIKPWVWLIVVLVTGTILILFTRFLIRRRKKI